jgi:hypothetical protein
VTVTALLQAVATAHSSPSWQSVAVVALGAAEGLGMLWIQSAIKTLRDLQLTQVTHGETLAALNTHVGVDGNGLIARLEGLTSEMRGLRTEVHSLAKEMAEQRGASGRIRHGGES